MRYYHSENVTRKKRRKRRIIKAGIVLALILMAGFLFVVRDLVRKQEVATLESETVKIITKLDGYKLFDESKFTIMLPEGWSRAKESTGSSLKYKSGSKTHEAMSLDIYIDGSILANFDTVRALPIKIEEGKIKPGLLSDRCYNFTKPKEGFDEKVVSPSLPSVWQGVNFICNFSKVLNYVTTVNAQTGYATKISGPTNSGTYQFTYTDHTSRPDFLVFNTILGSFRHK